MPKPSKYKPEFCELLIKHMNEGLSFEAFGAIAHVHKDTLNEWIKNHPEFKEARMIAESYGRMWWDKKGIQAVNGELGKDFNATVWVFTYKNRFHWRDKMDVESTEKPNKDQKETKEKVSKLLGMLEKMTKDQPGVRKLC